MASAQEKTKYGNNREKHPQPRISNQIMHRMSTNTQQFNVPQWLGGDSSSFSYSLEHETDSASHKATKSLL